MKAFVAVAVLAFVVCAQALSEEQKNKIKQISTECQQKSGVDQQLIQKARKGEFTNDPKLKAHLLCFAQKAGFMNEKNEIQSEAIKAKITPDVGADEATKVTQKCAAIKSATPEQTAFDVFKCFFDNTTKHISLS
ncbi:odorant binding protein [Rhyzopertha dominica]|uniref:Odorant-binding protein 11 n=1 Tax=Rhyzopertha dominica TaxID=92692 RepID=A0A0X8VWL7_RHYDO|nr:odorant-binding protein 11 [Rhyzopertha dominica]KAI7815286.1 odorant binding protein [Rhyzopertha dominica]